MAFSNVEKAEKHYIRSDSGLKLNSQCVDMSPDIPKEAPELTFDDPDGSDVKDETDHFSHFKKRQKIG